MADHVSCATGRPRARAALDSFNLTHTETDYLLTYPDVGGLSVEGEAQCLQGRMESERLVECCPA